MDSCHLSHVRSEVRQDIAEGAIINSRAEVDQESPQYWQESSFVLKKDIEDFFESPVWLDHGVVSN